MRELNRVLAQQLLDHQPVARIGVVVDGDPYVTAIAYVVDDGEVLFRTGPGQRLDAIRSHPRVCVEVSSYDVQTGEWSSAIILGDAAVVDDPDRSAQAERLLRDKYRRLSSSALVFPAEAPEEGWIVAVTMDELSARTSGSGLQREHRPGRL